MLIVAAATQGAVVAYGAVQRSVCGHLTLDAARIGRVHRLLGVNQVWANLGGGAIIP